MTSNVAVQRRGAASPLANVRHLVGNTPCLPICLEGCAATLHLKLEGQNPTGSVKDRAALHMLDVALTQDVLGAGKTVLDASSGNMACSLAYFCALAGVPVTVAVSSKLTLEKRHFLEHFGASILVRGDQTIEGNEHCRALASAAGGDRYLFVDQLHNWNNPDAHYQGTGPEILRSFPDCRMVVGSLGSGGTLFGVARYLKEHRPDILVVAAEAASGSRMPGVGAFEDGDYVTPFIRAGIEKGYFDIRRPVSFAEASEELLGVRSQGVFGGVQTGAVLRAARDVAESHNVVGDVVVIAGDTGWKNLESLTAIRAAAGRS